MRCQNAMTLWCGPLFLTFALLSTAPFGEVGGLWGHVTRSHLPSTNQRHIRSQCRRPGTSSDCRRWYPAAACHQISRCRALSLSTTVSVGLWRRGGLVVKLAVRERDGSTTWTDFSERYVKKRCAVEIAFPSVCLSITRVSCE